MFTGIVEEVGILKGIHLAGSSGSIEVQASKVLEGTKVGDSIATNGICLTVTSLKPDGFCADVMAQTVRQTGLLNMRAGDKLNLERAMPVDGRFGGHIVSGHIDGTGKIAKKETEENAVWVTIETSPEILRYIIPKGSITIDGISLTVATVTETYFQVSIIPHTSSETTLLLHKEGDVVNLENDVVGKYVEKLLSTPKKQETKSSNISMEMLLENGF